MASKSRPCAIKKCETSSCAVCHCCQADLCLEHLKEHKDRLNSELTPLANKINSFMDSLEHLNPTSLQSFTELEQWKAAAHITVEQFYERLCRDLFENKKIDSMKNLQNIRTILYEIDKKQGATRENIEYLTRSIRQIEEEINNFQNMKIRLSPLSIDENMIIQSVPNAREPQSQDDNQQTYHLPNTIYCESAKSKYEFQIFVELPIGITIFVTVEPSTTIAELKEKIRQRTEIPGNSQNLFYMGKILKDEFTLATYDIQRHFTLKLNVMMRREQ